MRDDGYDDDVTTRDVYAVQGNYVIDLNSFSSILREVAMCRACEAGSLELFDSGTKESCATFLILLCNSCHFHRSFWSVSGTFGKSSFSVSASKIRMRNDMVYSNILEGSLVGIGLDKFSHYHAILSIPSTPSRYTYSKAQRQGQRSWGGCRGFSPPNNECPIYFLVMFLLPLKCSKTGPSFNN